MFEFEPNFMDAIDKQDIERVKCLLEKYGIVQIFDEDLLNYSLTRGKFKVADYLLSMDFKIETKVEGKTLLYYQNSKGNQEAVDYLLEHGAKVDANKPLIKKISSSKFGELIKEETGDTLDVKALLKTHGFDMNLDYIEIEIPYKQFKEASLSGISCKDANIIVRKGTKLVLDGADIEGAFLQGNLFDVDNISLKNANISGTLGFITPELALTLNQLKDSHLLTIPKDQYFYQMRLYSKHGEILSEKAGQCHGLAFEYVRHALNAERKGKQETNFFSKLENKLNTPGENFFPRLNLYTKYGRPDVRDTEKHFKIEVDIENDKLKPIDFLSYLPEKLLKSNFLWLYLDGHSCVLRVFRDENKKVTGYKIYETSYGQTVLLSQNETNKAINSILSHWLDAEDNIFYVSDLEQAVQDLNLVGHDKDSKNTFKLFKAIDENNISEIARLSPIMKIDYHGTCNKDQLTEVICTNILDYATKNGSDEALVALIDNNKLLEELSLGS